MEESKLADQNFKPEWIPLEEVRQFMPDFVPLTPENTRSSNFGKAIHDHPFFQDALDSEVLPPDELDRIRDLTEGQLPQSVPEWDLMKESMRRQAKRRACRPKTEE